MPGLSLETREGLSNGFQPLSQTAIAFELFEMLCGRGREHQREGSQGVPRLLAVLRE